MKIVILDRSTIGPNVILNRPNFEHEWIEYDRTQHDEIKERISEADIVITNKVPIQEENLESATNLKMISVAATGYDIVDLDACKKRNITLSNVRGYAINTVPEHVFSLILSLRRSIIGYQRDVINGEWQKSGQFCFFNHPISDIKGCRLGIIGEGVIGESVGNIGKNGFGMDVVYMDHEQVKDRDGHLKFVSKDELIRTSDIISLHCPLLTSTKDMFKIEQFKKMKSTGIIINTARGGLIEEESLAEAIRENIIGGAAIDVLATEPPPSNHPYFELLKLSNFILTPHIAWASDQARQELWKQVIDNIENFHNGVSSNVVV